MTRRTSLRPVDGPSDDTAQTPPQPARPQPQDAPRQTHARTIVVAGAVVAAIATAVVLTAIGGARSDRGAPPPVPVITAQACPSIVSFLDVIGSYERQARWGLAASTAETALRTPGLCDGDRSALGQKAIALGQQALFEQPPEPEDAPGQRRVVTAYSDLKSRASQYGTPPPAPLAIAKTAYDSRLFLLATAAYADAFTSGDSSAQDRAVVRADYAAQYNLGSVWSQRTDPVQRAEGLARLVTACRIDESQRLGSMDACTELQRLVGPSSRWPAPAPDPLIDVAPTQVTAHGA